jgi:hypothetical protein
MRVNSCEQMLADYNVTVARANKAIAALKSSRLSSRLSGERLRDL